MTYFMFTQLLYTYKTKMKGTKTNKNKLKSF